MMKVTVHFLYCYLNRFKCYVSRILPQACSFGIIHQKLELWARGAALSIQCLPSILEALDLILPTIQIAHSQSQHLGGRGEVEAGGSELQGQCWLVVSSGPACGACTGVSACVRVVCLFVERNFYFSWYFKSFEASISEKHLIKHCM